MISVTSGIYCTYNNNIKEKTPLELEQELSKANKEIERLNKENKNLKKIIFEARKMIFDNYGVLDKYEIELLDDVLKGSEDNDI